ncbi:hypothetical protein M404DRAFT_309935 [Pisolithus tinctorius Marx 270]|uniref:Uncharacterized protein n=1 Tax=Pisolithus tinctorius Marx 270 TaxID=870435 RepID=A0A0C3PKV7_PISTI|nr:hypothetical protein M404DRAFT_309935 [Pisolithus tinctorius Marx 270]
MGPIIRRSTGKYISGDLNASQYGTREPSTVFTFEAASWTSAVRNVTGYTNQSMQSNGLAMVSSCVQPSMFILSCPSLHIPPTLVVSQLRHKKVRMLPSSRDMPARQR